MLFIWDITKYPSPVGRTEISMCRMGAMERKAQRTVEGYLIECRIVVSLTYEADGVNEDFGKRHVAEMMHTTRYCNN